MEYGVKATMRAIPNRDKDERPSYYDTPRVVGEGQYL